MAICSNCQLLSSFDTGVKTTCSIAIEKSEAPKAFEGHPDFFGLSANGFEKFVSLRVALVHGTSVLFSLFLSSFDTGVKTTCSFAIEKSEAPKAFEGRPDFFSLSANAFLCGLCGFA